MPNHGIRTAVTASTAEQGILRAVPNHGIRTTVTASTAEQGILKAGSESLTTGTHLKSLQLLLVHPRQRSKLFLNVSLGR